MKARDPITYLADVLQRNPLYEAEQIIDSRAAFLGLDKRRDAPQPQRHDQQALREGLQTEIDAVRSKFWTLALDELFQRIDALDADRFPELQPVVRRLRTIAGLRAAFPRLASHERAYLPLVHALKRCAALPPFDAGKIKEQFLRGLSRSGDLKAARETVGMIRREFPELYELEADWLKTIEQLKASSR